MLNTPSADKLQKMRNKARDRYRRQRELIFEDEEDTTHVKNTATGGAPLIYKYPDVNPKTALNIARELLKN